MLVSILGSHNFNLATFVFRLHYVFQPIRIYQKFYICFSIASNWHSPSKMNKVNTEMTPPIQYSNSFVQTINKF